MSNEYSSPATGNYEYKPKAKCYIAVKLEEHHPCCRAFVGYRKIDQGRLMMQLLRHVNATHHGLLQTAFDSSSFSLLRT
jgi:hypothetical protein